MPDDVWPPPPSTHEPPVSAPVAPTLNAVALRVIIEYDLLVGLLFADAVFTPTYSGPSVAVSQIPQPSWQEEAAALLPVAPILTMLGAAVCLMLFLAKGQHSALRNAALCQWVAAWCHLLMIVIAILSLSLPRQGGVGGFLLLMDLPFLFVSTVIAFVAAAYLQRVSVPASLD